MSRGRGRRTQRAPAVRVQTLAGVAEVVPDRARPGGRLLLLEGMASAYVDLDDPRHLGFDYVHRIAEALDVLRPRGAPLDAVHLGGGGFTLARYLAATRPGARSEVYEHDPAVVELARAHLGLRTGPGLRVRVGDARERLAARPADSADVVIGDAFTGTDVPAHLATAEFAGAVQRVLRPRGVYLLNVVDVPPLAFARAEAATLRMAFAHVAALGDRSVTRGRHAGNLVLLASATLLPTARLARRLAGGAHPSELLAGDRLAGFTGGARPLTDPA